MYVSVLQIGLWVLLIVSTPLCGIAPLQELFEQANICYTQGAFSNALDLYQQIEPKDAAIELNMGLCYLQLKQLGNALLHLRRAERMWPLWKNRSQLVSGIAHIVGIRSGGEPNTLTYWRVYLCSLVTSLPLVVIQLLFLLIWATLFMFARALYKRQARLYIILLFIGVLFIGTVLAIRYSLTMRNRAVIIASSSVLRSGPGDFPTIGVLNEAAQVTITRIEGDFYKVSGAGRIGWTDSKSLQAI